MAMRLNKNVEKLDVYKPAEPYSKVSIYVGVDQNGDEVYYTAGDDSGKELLIECPWGTSTMASVLLAKIGGYAYNGYDAKKAILNPAAELGDAVNVDGVASRIYTQKTNFDALYSSDIAAPPNEEIDDDYTYYSPDIKATRKLASTVATLRVNVDSIEAEVTGKIDDQEAETLIKAALNNITLSVSTGSNTNTSKITLTGDGISAVSDNITLTANSINLNTCTVTGTLGVNNISSIGKGVTMLSDSTATEPWNSQFMWIGPHTYEAPPSAGDNPKKIIGQYISQFTNTSSSPPQNGIEMVAWYKPTQSGSHRRSSLWLTSVVSELAFWNGNYRTSSLEVRDNSASMFGGYSSIYADNSGIDIEYDNGSTRNKILMDSNGIKIRFTTGNTYKTIVEISSSNVKIYDPVNGNQAINVTSSDIYFTKPGSSPTQYCTLSQILAVV